MFPVGPREKTAQAPFQIWRHTRRLTFSALEAPDTLIILAALNRWTYRRGGPLCGSVVDQGGRGLLGGHGARASGKAIAKRYRYTAKMRVQPIEVVGLSCLRAGLVTPLPGGLGIDLPAL